MKNYILFFLFVSSYASSNPIEEVVVRSPYQAYQNTPITYHTINKNLIDSQGSLVEPSYLLSKTPSVSAYSDSGSYQGYSYFRIRGIDQTRINMTLDGIPLNEPEDQGVYFSNYPGIFDALQNVQVQRGVGLSQNGTASFGGSIQLESIDLSATPTASITGTYGSFDTWSGTVNNLSQFSDNGALYLQASGVTTSGYKYDSGNRSHSIFGSAEINDDYGHWDFLAFTGEQDNDLAWLGVTQENLNNDRRTNSNKNEDDVFKQSLVSVSRNLTFSETLTMDIRTYYSQLKGNYDFDMNNFLGINEPGDIYNYAFDSDFAGLFSTLNYYSQSLHVTAGFHVNDYSRKHTGSEKTIGALYQNIGYKDSQTLFLKAEYNLDSFLFFADLEHRKTSFDYKGNTDFPQLNWSFYNPRVGTSFTFTDRLISYYSVGRTSREPTRTDLFGGMDNLETGDDGQPLVYPLKPEKVTDHELGIRYSVDNARASINVFHMAFDHEITLNGNFGPNGLQLNQDVDKSVREGIEFATELKLTSTISWSASAARSHNRIDNQGENFQPVLTPEWIVYTAIDSVMGKFGYGLEARYQSMSYINLGNTEMVGSYTLVNGYLGYDWNSAELKLYVNNILDRDYFASGSLNANGDAAYFVGAPANILVQLRMEL